MPPSLSTRILGTDRSDSRRVDRLGEFGVPTKPIAVAPDVDDVALVPDRVQQCRCHHLVSQDLAPFLETLVRGRHRWGPPVLPQWHRQHLCAIPFNAGLERWPLGDKRMFAVPAERTIEAKCRDGDTPCKDTEP